MKSIEAKMIVETINNVYQLQVVLNLEAVTGYETEIENGDIEKIHIYLKSGKDRVLDSGVWNQEVLKTFTDKLNDHFFPSIPSDDDEIKPDKIDFYYC